nr:unnamed protein product [Callosobruchus analis]
MKSRSFVMSGKYCSIVLENVSRKKISVTRQALKDQRDYEDLNEVAKLFNIHEDVDEARVNDGTQLSSRITESSNARRAGNVATRDGELSSSNTSVVKIGSVQKNGYMKSRSFVMSGKYCSIVLENVSRKKISVTRQVLKDKRDYEDLNEVAKLFNIHEDVDEARVMFELRHIGPILPTKLHLAISFIRGNMNLDMKLYKTWKEI